ncbi:uncharacterized protein M421DRAFT_7942 [Didymella exigua CBS 183.55]|uniref:BHLH domain-containing protein n=1 Tax=Didymella exigua CBS 183.55 TaxID=1150837 RepID=A0A6A5RDJ0_9PLEO|nr:uncharacterized protein M421DRAFT_7942 [Didymella exigua CBS 183.55]KAF1925469.1 hypothetical protein M421DRAFT_7942 [Didymella exigua CBS 183.55]
MSDKDPPPFGYTFSADYLHPLDQSLDQSQDQSQDHHGPSPDHHHHHHQHHHQSLLSDMEGQSLADFFSNTDPFSLSDSQPFGPPADAKLAGNDFSDWSFMAPATVHHVSATIPDQAQLHHGFPSEHMFAMQPLDHLGTTHDDLQAASTLFHNSQQPAAALFPDMSPSMAPSMAPSMPPASALFHDMPPAHAPGGRPMVATSQGLLNEQLAALLPNHAAAGTLDAQLAAQWAASDAHNSIHGGFAPALPRPALKRTYTFGTDDAFRNPAAFSAPHSETEAQVTRRLMRDTRTLSFIADVHAPELAAAADPADPSSSSSSSPDAASSADDSQPSRRRTKSVPPRKDALRKTASGTRVSKAKKPAAPDSDSKKRRASAAASKLARENLSEAQKRSNHILSEQKRRNLIKRGFDDLHDLVPDIRNGGLSKSSVLTEAANFLERLIADNQELVKLGGGAG